MYKEIFQVILEVSILLDQRLVVHNIKKSFFVIVNNMNNFWLMWWLIFSCQWSRCFLWGQLWYHKVLFQSLFQVPVWLIFSPPNLLLTLIFSSRSSKYVSRVEMFFSWSISFYENLVDFFLWTLGGFWES